MSEIKYFSYYSLSTRSKRSSKQCFGKAISLQTLNTKDLINNGRALWPDRRKSRQIEVFSWSFSQHVGVSLDFHHFLTLAQLSFSKFKVGDQNRPICAWILSQYQQNASENGWRTLNCFLIDTSIIPHVPKEIIFIHRREAATHQYNSYICSFSLPPLKAWLRLYWCCKCCSSYICKWWTAA